MAVFKKRKLRGAPRIRLDDENSTGAKNIRFTSSKYANVLTSSIYDISETGIAFTCSRKLAPKINEIIKVELAAFSSIHLACLGRVVRIESPTSQAAWSQFPDSVKVGVCYYQMPRSYKKLMSESIKTAFSIRNIIPNTDTYYYSDMLKFSSSAELKWLQGNWVSLLITLGIILGSVFAGVMMIDSAENRKPASSPEWSKNFFQKIKVDKK